MGHDVHEVILMVCLLLSQRMTKRRQPRRLVPDFYFEHFQKTYQRQPELVGLQDLGIYGVQKVHTLVSSKVG